MAWHQHMGRHLMGAVVLAALAACGGGGSSSSNNTGGNTQPTASVSGVAAKGLLKRARVQALRASDNTQLAETQTNEQGGYTLTGLPPGVAVLIKVTPIAGQTRMVDEATNQEVEPPSNFVLRAAVVASDSGIASVQVTPFSEMAVKKAEDAGGLSASNILAANADIRRFVNFDILAEAPVFTSDGFTASNKVALLLAAVSRLAKDDGLGCSSSSGDAAAAQAEKVQCVVAALASRGSDDDDVATALEDAKNSVYDDDYEPESEAEAERPEIYKQPEELRGSDDDGSTGSAINAAKELIANVRSNGGALNGSGSAFEGSVRDVAALFQGAANPLGDSSRELYAGVLEATNFLAEGTATGPVSLRTKVARSAGCRFYSDPYTAETLDNEVGSAAEAQTVGCRITYRVIHDEETDEYFAFQHQFRVGNQVPYQIRSRLIKQKLTPVTDGQGNIVSFDVDTGTAPDNLAPRAGDPFYGKFYPGNIRVEYDEANNYPSSFLMDGYYAGGLNQVLSGQAYANHMRLSLVPSYATIEGSSTDTLVTLTMSNSYFEAIDGEAPTVRVNLGTSYIQAQFDNAVSRSLMATETLRTSRRMELQLSASAANSGAAVYATLQAHDTALLDGEGVPTVYTLIGSVYDADENSIFDGRVTIRVESFGSFDRRLAYGPTNKVEGPSVSLRGDFYPPGRPYMSIDVTVAHAYDTNGIGRLSLTGHYEQGDLYVAVAATRLANGSSPGQAEFSVSDDSGISLRIREGSSFATLYKDGTINLGTLNLRNAKLQYADGSYEQY